MHAGLYRSHLDTGRWSLTPRAGRISPAGGAIPPAGLRPITTRIRRANSVAAATIRADAATSRISSLIADTLLSLPRPLGADLVSPGAYDDVSWAAGGSSVDDGDDGDDLVVRGGRERR